MLGSTWTQGYASRLKTQGPRHSRALSSGSTPETDEGKKTESPKGFPYQFIPLRRSHLDFVKAMTGRYPPDFERCVGKTMVDDLYRPLGFCFVAFEDDGVTCHAYFGKWLRVWPKDILRGMKPVFDRLREMEEHFVFAVADEEVEGSDKLIHWFKGVKTDRRADTGPIYLIDLRDTPI